MAKTELPAGFYFKEDTHAYYMDGVKMTGITTVIGVLAKPQLIGWAARMAVEFMEKAITSGEYDLTDKAVLGDLLDAAKSAHQKKKEEAGTHGTDAHALVESWVNSQISHTISDVDYKPIKQFIDWATDNVDHFLFSERRMHNKDLFIAGTADFGAVMKDGKRLIGDFKTSSGVYGIDYFLQCAGYRILAENEGDKPYDGCVIVRLGKDGSFGVHYRYAEQSTKSAPTDLWKRLMGFVGIKQADIINYSDIDVKAFMACLTLYRAQATYKPNQ